MDGELRVVVIPHGRDWAIVKNPAVVMGGPSNGRLVLPIRAEAYWSGTQWLTESMADAKRYEVRGQAEAEARQIRLLAKKSP
jgi:hypothetical protein